MTAAEDSLIATRDGDALPVPVSGEQREINGRSGRLAYYVADPSGGAESAPLLLIHSVNAAGSAYEVRPLFEHYRKSRIVYALELPGFGHSERGKREYTVRLMTDAIHDIVDVIRRDHPTTQIDALAVSLSCEFLARAISEKPEAYRSAALVSPTGFSTAPKASRWRDETRGMPRLHAFFEYPLWSKKFFELLSTQVSINFFLKKTWGSNKFDRGLAAYDYKTTHQDGARHAPYYFVSGFLFSKNTMTVYQSLTLPVWMVHGTRGDFVNYSFKTEVSNRPNWTIDVFETGAMPHFEAEDAFVQKYDAFVTRVGAKSII